MSHPFPPKALRRCHAQTARVIKNFLNPKGHQNPISGSKVKAILLKGLILPIGGVASERVCTQSESFSDTLQVSQDLDIIFF